MQETKRAVIVERNNVVGQEDSSLVSVGAAAEAEATLQLNPAAQTEDSFVLQTASEMLLDG